MLAQEMGMFRYQEVLCIQTEEFGGERKKIRKVN